MTKQDNVMRNLVTANAKETQIFHTLLNTLYIHFYFYIDFYFKSYKLKIKLKNNQIF